MRDADEQAADTAVRLVSQDLHPSRPPNWWSQRLTCSYYSKYQNHRKRKHDRKTSESPSYGLKAKERMRDTERQKKTLKQATITLIFGELSSRTVNTDYGRLWRKIPFFRLMESTATRNPCLPANASFSNMPKGSQEKNSFFLVPFVSAKKNMLIFFL